MPQLIIDVPDTLMPLLTSKAEAYGQTPEDFIVGYLLDTLEYLSDNVTVLTSYETVDSDSLENILEKRDKGPFVPAPEDLVEKVMEKAMGRIQGAKHMIDSVQRMHPDVGDVDLVELVKRLPADDPEAAKKVVSAICEMFPILTENPLLGIECHSLRHSLEGIRMSTVPDYSQYLIYYRRLSENDGVRILFVLDGALDLVAFAEEHCRQ